MRKRDELADPNSYWNKARDDELVFVILERDLAATSAISRWISERVALGLNSPGDQQLKDARALAQAIEARRGRHED